MTGNHRASGQTLIELLIASGVFLITMMSAFAVIHGGRSLVVDTQQAVQAADFIREGLESSRLIRDRGWDNLVDGTYGIAYSGGQWNFVPGSDTQSGYTRTVTVTSVSANVKSVSAQVAWSGPNARSQQASSAMLLTNWAQTQEDNFLEGDWQNPVTLGTADLESGTAASDVRVENQKVYLSSQASNQSKPDFSVVDVAGTPAILSSVDLGISNLSALAKSGNYAYGSIYGATNEFLVIDVSNPASPVSVKTMDFSNGRSKSIEVVGTTLYVGMEQITGEPEFYVFDVTDPINPLLLGSHEVNGTINAINIFNNRAYIATSVDDAEMMVLNVGNPAAITQHAAYDATGNEDGTAIFVKDEFNVYLGRASSATSPEFSILDASVAATIVVRSTFNMATRVNDLVVVNRLAFLITEEANAEMRILDVSNPASVTSYAQMNFPQAATGIDYENNTIYTSVRSQNALRVIGPGP